MATTIEDRVSKLEGAYEHLATKADLAELKADMIKWMVGLMLASAGLAATIALVIQRFASG
ncbi:MAG: hypothetical protein OXG07_01235 [Anaerolineaceae bacterium]|nr:hypothetical protein [Anaerolineaceae bacterium]MCY3906265.1 hypothetical protein [Anaerolineaceae bacterium]